MISKKEKKTYNNQNQLISSNPISEFSVFMDLWLKFKNTKIEGKKNLGLCTLKYMSRQGIKISTAEL